MIFLSLVDFKLVNHICCPTPHLSTHGFPHLDIGSNFNESHYFFSSGIVYGTNFWLFAVDKVKAKLKGE
jgi:hypothetical protein